MPAVLGVVLLDDAASAASGPFHWVHRLRRGGLHAELVSNTRAALAVAQSWHLSTEQVVMITCSGYSASLDDDASWGGVTWRDASQTAQGCALRPGEASQPATCDELMRAIVQHNRRCQLAAPTAAAAVPAQRPSETARGAALVVGYALKPSREEQLAGAGLLQLLPLGGVACMPLTLGVPLGQQGHLDILLHKASDALEALAPSAQPHTPLDGAVGYSPHMLQLQREAAALPAGTCVVDPFDAVAQVFDRTVLCRVLDGLAALQLPGGVRARAPKWAAITSADLADLPALAQRLRSCGLGAPLLVKPNTACGVAWAHSMALVLEDAALARVQGAVPLPAVVQQFINHGGWQHKVYALGRKVGVRGSAAAQPSS